jgi:hypothetical protein
LEKDGDWGNQMRKIWNKCVQFCHQSSKNWSNELASESLPGVSGDELEGLREVLNSKFPKVCEGWRMIQLQV